jgi:hypothetical protein
MPPADLAVGGGEDVRVDRVDVAVVVNEPVAGFAVLLGPPFVVAESGGVQAQRHRDNKLVRPAAVTPTFGYWGRFRSKSGEVK